MECTSKDDNSDEFSAGRVASSHNLIQGLFCSIRNSLGDLIDEILKVVDVGVRDSFGKSLATVFSVLFSNNLTL